MGKRKERGGWGWVLAPRGPIPEEARRVLADRLARHLARRWSGRVKKLLLAFHGKHARVAVVEGAPKGKGGLPEVARYVEGDEVPLMLCRLGYLGSVDRWRFEFFKYSDERFELAMGPSGSFEVTPEQALDAAGGVHLVEWPATRPTRRGRAKRR